MGPQSPRTRPQLGAVVKGCRSQKNQNCEGEFLEHRMGFEPMNTGFADLEVLLGLVCVCLYLFVNKLIT
jgi:hypothetical protein